MFWFQIMNNVDDSDRITFFSSEINSVKPNNNVAATKTNIFLLDTTTLLSVLVIVVFMIKLFNNVLKSNGISTTGGKRSFQTKLFGKMCWNCDQEIDRRKNSLRLRKRMHSSSTMMMPSPTSRQSGGVR